MPVTITLDRLIRDRGMTGKALSKAIGISETQLSMLRSGKVRGIRFNTLARLCAILECKPGELLDYGFAETDLSKPDKAK